MRHVNYTVREAALKNVSNQKKKQSLDKKENFGISSTKNLAYISSILGPDYMSRAGPVFRDLGTPVKHNKINFAIT